jgi:hypothetical protein
MNYVYRTTLSVDMFGNKVSYEFKVRKCKVKSVTDKNVVLDGKRLKKEELNQIQSGRFTNSTRNINYEVWVEEESKIEYFKPLLIEKIKILIVKYREDLNKLELVMQNEPENIFKDDTIDD